MKLIIKGKKKIQGTITISGSKNSAVAIIPAAILCDEEVIIRNIPNITDCTSIVNIMSDAGFSISFKDNIVRINKLGKISKHLINNEISNLRGSYYLMGAYLGMYKKICISSFGGCNLGYRPINYHLDGFRKLNVKIKEKNNILYLKTNKIKGNIIDLDYPSVGATINLILAAVKGKKTTIINNCAIEPEVSDLCNFLNSMGADIKGIDTNKITITGVKYLHKTDYTIISDRIEAGTFLAIGALSESSSITVKNINPSYLTSLIKVFEKMDLNVVVRESMISIKREKQLLPISITTSPYPEFPTDLGPIITSLFTQIEGESILRETVFSNRFSHVNELNKMGANIEIDNDTLYVKGISKFKSATVYCHDLRCAASLLVAACANRATTTLENFEILFRGYENIIEKLERIGIKAKIE